MNKQRTAILGFAIVMGLSLQGYSSSPSDACGFPFSVQYVNIAKVSSGASNLAGVSFFVPDKGFSAASVQFLVDDSLAPGGVELEVGFQEANKSGNALQPSGKWIEGRTVRHECLTAGIQQVKFDPPIKLEHGNQFLVLRLPEKSDNSVVPIQLIPGVATISPESFSSAVRPCVFPRSEQSVQASGVYSENEKRARPWTPGPGVFLIHSPANEAIGFPFSTSRLLLRSSSEELIQGFQPTNRDIQLGNIAFRARLGKDSLAGLDLKVSLVDDHSGAVLDEQIVQIHPEPSDSQVAGALIEVALHAPVKVDAGHGFSVHFKLAEEGIQKGNHLFFVGSAISPEWELNAEATLTLFGQGAMLPATSVSSKPGSATAKEKELPTYLPVIVY